MSRLSAVARRLVGGLAFIGVVPTDPDELRTRKVTLTLAASTVTASTHERLRERYRLEDRGEIDVKSKGRLRAYLLVGRLDAGVAPPPRPRPVDP